MDPSALHFRLDHNPCTAHPTTGAQVANPDYGKPLDEGPVAWWELPMLSFSSQFRKHCHECGIPLRGHGELAQADMLPSSSHNRGSETFHEQTSKTHASIYLPKRTGRSVQLVMAPDELGAPVPRVIDYLRNAGR